MAKKKGITSTFYMRKSSCTVVRARLCNGILVGGQLIWAKSGKPVRKPGKRDRRGRFIRGRG